MSLLKSAATMYGWYLNPEQFFRDMTKQEPVAGQKKLLSYLRGPTNRILVCAACLAEGTPIQLAKGKTKPIEKMKRGDKILSYNLEEKKIEIKRVKSVFDHGLADVYRFRDKENEIFLTDDHPVLTKKGWMPASVFSCKEDCPAFRKVFRIDTHDTSLQVKERLAKLDRKIGVKRIYDLSIEGSDNFVANGFIVHNSGVGKTRVLAVAALWTCIVLPYIKKKPVQVLILSGSLEQSKVLYEYTREFIHNSPIIESQIEERLKTETRFTNGALLKALPCSERAYFGKHVDFLLIDEAALKDFPEQLLDHALSIVAPIEGSKLVMSSTPYNANSRFVSLWETAEKQKGWERIGWQAADCHFIKPEDIEEARLTLPKEEFEIRWQGKITPQEDTLIRKESLKKCIGEVKPRKSLEPIVFGMDWGFRHPTVIVVVQKEKDKWNILTTRFWRQARIDKLYDDVIALYNIYKPVSIYADSSHIFENNKLIEMGLPVFPINFRKEKELMVSNLISLIEHEKVLIWEEEVALIAQLRDYKRKMRKDDDWVDALMLAIKEDIQSRNLPFFYRTVEY